MQIRVFLIVSRYKAAKIIYIQASRARLTMNRFCVYCATCVCALASNNEYSLAAPSAKGQHNAITVSNTNNSLHQAETYVIMATNLARSGRLKEAEKYQLKALAIWEAHPGADNCNLSNGLNSVICFYKDSGQLDKAAKNMERALALWLRRDPSMESAEEFIMQLSMLHMKLKNYTKAEPLLEKLHTMRSREGFSSRLNCGSYVEELLCTAQTNLGKLTEAEQHINVAKRHYDNSGTAFAFGEVYSTHFLEVYTQFLQKSGRTEEFVVFNDRLKALEARIAQSCRGCGMG